MKEITQNDLIKLIEEKQENAKNELERAFNMREDEGKECAQTNKAYVDAYQDLICYLNSVKIVPEEITQKDTELLEPLCNKCSKTEEVCPFHRMGSAYEVCSEFEEQQPKVEPLRNDRFREFEFLNYDESTIIVTIDAKEVVGITRLQRDKDYNVAIEGKSIRYYAKRFTKESEATSYYNDLVEWLKYWKQM